MNGGECYRYEGVKDGIDGSTMVGSRGLGSGGRKRGRREVGGCIRNVMRVEKDREEVMKG